MGDYYKLDGHEAVLVPDVMDWARWFEGNNRHVENTTIGDVRISTVFLGIDHSYGFGPPQIFETMIFGGPHDQYQERCSTWDEAEAQHEKACELVKEFPEGGPR